MRVKEALERATQTLAANYEEAPLEAEILMRHALGLDRAGLLVQLERELTAEEEAAFWSLHQRRLHGEPIPYITGHKEFFGLDFCVDRRVLIPRPETELLVEKALELVKGHPGPRIADVGTGSGAIAIALARNLPQARLYAIDISREALEVATLNCQRHGVSSQVQLLQGDLLEPLPEAVDVIVANLPYVGVAEFKMLDPQLEKEPRLALAGGGDGLDMIRRLLAQAPGRLRGGGGLLVEIGLGQREALARVVRGLFPEAHVEIFRDLGQIERVALIGLHP